MNEARREPAPGRYQGKHADPRSRVSEAATDRRAGRIAAAERSLAEAYASLRATGVDPDSVNIAFAIARDCLAEARECSERARRELILAQSERLQGHRERLSNSPHAEPAVDPVIPDLPGVDLCPDPQEAGTVAELMETLRAYWVWAGKPSYRIMARQCGSRFAASTIHTALHGTRLPSLDMIRAIVTACGGTDEHRRAFASAWRRLEMPQHGATGRPQARTLLYPVGESA